MMESEKTRYSHTPSNLKPQVKDFLYFLRDLHVFFARLLFRDIFQ